MPSSSSLLLTVFATLFDLITVFLVSTFVDVSLLFVMIPVIIGFFRHSYLSSAIILLFVLGAKLIVSTVFTVSFVFPFYAGAPEFPRFGGNRFHGSFRSVAFHGSTFPPFLLSSTFPPSSFPPFLPFFGTSFHTTNLVEFSSFPAISSFSDDLLLPCRFPPFLPR